MATYPVLPTSYGTDPKPINTLEIDRAVDGTGRVRSFQAVDKASIQLKHPWLSAADKATLAAFYSANRLLPFDYVSLADGATRSCVFKAPPAWTVRPGSRYDAAVELEQV